tara:strand:- start:112 stop:417 length:306 start_codon:yes stop_codon:yes gene_type:complete
MTIEASPGGLIPPLLYSCSIKPRPIGVKSMPSFELIQFNSDGTTDRKEIDINKLNSAEDVAKEAKGFFAKNKKGKKVYTSTRENKLASLKVYEPRSQEKKD